MLMKTNRSNKSDAEKGIGEKRCDMRLMRTGLWAVVAVALAVVCTLGMGIGVSYAYSGIPGVTVNLYDYDTPEINYTSKTSAGDWRYNYVWRDFRFGNGAGNYEVNNATNASNHYDRMNSWSGSSKLTQGIASNTLANSDLSNFALSSTYGGGKLSYLFDGSTSGVRRAYQDVNVSGLFGDKDDQGNYTYDSSKYTASYANGALTKGGPPTSNLRANFMPFGSENYSFGMTVQANFLYPTGGKVNGNNMVFSFNGDDDVWVYVDGKLALDLGGIHQANSGKIDFATRQVTYDDGTPTQSFESLHLDMGSAWSTHKLTFIYFERGAGGSNYKISFNMPTVPEGTAQIEKDVTYNNVNNISDVDFVFNAYINYAGDDNDSNYKLFTGKYDVVDKATGQTVKTDEDATNGCIVLKDGQIATLKSSDGKTIKETSKYYVTEVGATSDKYTVTINGKQSSKDNVTPAGVTSDKFTVGQTRRLVFDNSISAQNAFNLKVQKSGDGLPTDQTYYMKVMIGKKPDEKPYTGTYQVYDSNNNAVDDPKTASSDGIIELKAGQYAEIVGLQGGNTVSAQEVTQSGDDFAEGTTIGHYTYKAPVYSVDGGAAIAYGSSTTDGKAQATANEGKALGTNPVITLTATNTIKAGQLKVGKKVTGGASNPSQHFSFQLKSYSLAGKTFAVSVANQLTSDTSDMHSTSVKFDTDGTATLQLANGEVATIANLPVDAKVEVSETGLAANAYQSVSATVDGVEASGFTLNSEGTATTAVDATIHDGSATVVTVTNKFDFAPSNGINNNSTPMAVLLSAVVVGGIALALQRRVHVRRDGYARKE